MEKQDYRQAQRLNRIGLSIVWPNYLNNSSE
jgi:hypothetical protein